MPKGGRRLWLRALGFVLSVVPATLAAAEHFPVWLEGEKGTLSVLGVLVLLLCLLPFRRALRRALASPSAWQIWLALLVGILLIRHLAEGMLVVAAVAFPTSLAGAVCFRLAEDKRGEETDA